MPSSPLTELTTISFGFLSARSLTALSATLFAADSLAATWYSSECLPEPAVRLSAGRFRAATSGPPEEQFGSDRLFAQKYSYFAVVALSPFRLVEVVSVFYLICSPAGTARTLPASVQYSVAGSA